MTTHSGGALPAREGVAAPQVPLRPSIAPPVNFHAPVVGYAGGVGTLMAHLQVAPQFVRNFVGGTRQSGQPWDLHAAKHAPGIASDAGRSSSPGPP